ncbi:MAG: autotransporter outer membrane beta-barrel domain-containing protein, partial [Hyphococcus sp.]
GAAVTGGFASQTLPEATPLLRFDLVQLADRVQVVADAASFATVASSDPADQAFAAQLDDAAQVAGGALAEELARIQQLPGGADFETRIAQLNPARFDSFVQETATTIERFESGAKERLALLRQANGASGDSTFVRRAAPLRFAGAPQVDVGGGVLYGAWRAQFGVAEDFAGGGRGSISGFDLLLPSGSVFGASFGATQTLSLSSSLSRQQGRVDTFMMSFYGSHRFRDNQYIDGVVSYGEQAYDAASLALAGDRLSSFDARHEGRNVSASLETGRSFALAGGRSELFTGIRYESIGEDAFNADALGLVALNVQRQDTHGVEGEIGARIGWNLSTALGTVAPRVSLAWNRRLALSDDRVVATFADAPGVAFDLPSALRNANELRLGAGLDLWSSQNVALSGRFETDIMNVQRSHDALVELRFSF